MLSVDTKEPLSPADDTCAGAEAIAKLIGKTLRQTNYLLETDQLPAFKIGRTWHMRRSTYLRHIESLEAEAIARVAAGAA